MVQLPLSFLGEVNITLAPTEVKVHNATNRSLSVSMWMS